MFWETMPVWLPAVSWLIFTIILIIIELETLNLVTVWFAIGAIAAMITSFFLPQHIILQAFIFIIVSLIILVSMRDFARKRLKVGQTNTNVHALIGRRVKVTQRIEPYAFGEVRVDGVLWTAVGVNEEVIEVDEIVEIVEISGVKLVVQRVNNELDQNQN